MKYKRNFLKEVIFRIDFISPIQITQLQLKDFTYRVGDVFLPFRKEEAEEARIDIDGDTKEIKHSIQKITSWVLKNESKTKTITFSNGSFFIHYETYSDSKELLGDVENVVKVFIEIFEVKELKRLGLRYCNEISLNEKDVLNWNKYINNDLLGALNVAIGKSKVVARAMNLLVFKEEQAVVNFNYGIWNKNFPDEINEKTFLLDYDCYSPLPLNTEEFDIVQKTKTFNKHIESLFEFSITSGYRKLLK